MGFDTETSGRKGGVRVLGIIAAACVATSVSSCVATSSSSPLNYNDEGATWCAPVNQYPEVALGAPLDFPNGESIEVISVEAVDPVGLEVVGASVMPVDPHWRLQLTGYPPQDEFPDTWPEAIPARGASIDAGTTADLVTEVRYLGHGEASLSSLRIHYQQGETEYVADTHIALRMTKAPCN